MRRGRIWAYLVWRRDLTNASNYLWGSCPEEGTRLFLIVQSDRTRSNGHKLNRNFHLNTRKHFLPLRVWSLPLQRHPKTLWVCSCVTCSRWFFFVRGLDWVISRGLFQPNESVILDRVSSATLSLCYTYSGDCVSPRNSRWGTKSWEMRQKTQMSSPGRPSWEPYPHWEPWGQYLASIHNSLGASTLQ